MKRKEKNRDTAYENRQDTRPNKETDNINTRNNNMNVDTPSTNEPDVERANDSGLGDSGWNRDRLSNYTQNHSSDA
jgi:hypothetical protein